MKALAVLTLAGVLALAAAGQVQAKPVSLHPQYGSPDPARTVLRTGDLGGAHVVHQGYRKDNDFPSVISYSRQFEAPRAAGVPLLGLDSQAEVGTTAAAASSFVAVIKRYLATPRGRADFKRAFLGSGGDVLATGKVTVSPPQRLGVGNGVVVALRFRTLGLATTAAARSSTSVVCLEASR